jgi:dTDP-4-dehydrorhamnose reductase
MKILITGANGFLSYYIIEKLIGANQLVIATSKGPSRLPFVSSFFIYEEMDFTNAATVAAVFKKYQPTHIIHTGAISKPDECEQNKPIADKINVNGTAILLDAAKKYKAYFLLMSTDFIFDGINGMYAEDDTPNPVNYYGKTKVKAEALVKQYEHNWSIVRTVLGYGKTFSGRHNIITAVKEKLEKGETYNMFNDQVRTPTYIGDLAEGIITMIEKNATGIFHICGEEVFTPYEMAIATAEFLQLNQLLIKKVNAADFIQPAKRPAKTGLKIDKAKKELGYQPVSFREGLRRTLE